MAMQRTDTKTRKSWALCGGNVGDDDDDDGKYGMDIDDFEKVEQDIAELQSKLASTRAENKAEKFREQQLEQMALTDDELKNMLALHKQIIEREKALLSVENERLHELNDELADNQDELEREVKQLKEEVGRVTATRAALDKEVAELAKRNAELSQTRRKFEGMLKLTENSAESLEKIENALFENLETIQESTKEEKRTQMRDIFMAFDMDIDGDGLTDGVIDISDEQSMKKMRGYLASVKNVYREKMDELNFDLNGDGQVTWEEFCEVMSRDNFWADLAEEKKQGEEDKKTARDAAMKEKEDAAQAAKEAAAAVAKKEPEATAAAAMREGEEAAAAVATKEQEAAARKAKKEAAEAKYAAYLAKEKEDAAAKEAADMVEPADENKIAVSL